MMPPRTVLVTGANGYIGNAVARAFSRAGWITYGLVRLENASRSLELEEVLPVIGKIDDVESHQSIVQQLPATVNAIVSTTESFDNYTNHFNNTVSLLRTISLASKANGIRPLVIISSGCKDYGIGPHYDGASDLQPHTEESPLNPPELLSIRTRSSLEIFQHKDAFAPVVVRPTNVFGRSASYYRGFFEVAARYSKLNQPLVLPVPPSSICHALHVDDCGDAYAALASHPRPGEVEGQVFNISARRYETVDEIAKALLAEYDISSGLKYVEPNALPQSENPWPPALIDFPQWTSSEKLRKVTGWSDVRPLFSEALHLYRLSYEAASAGGHENIQKIAEREKLFKEKYRA
jgi:nucleoside-diphosphate-sugar epimerase